MSYVGQRSRLAASIAVLTLVACGGGGSSGVPTEPNGWDVIEGTWAGASEAHELTIFFGPAPGPGPCTLSPPEHCLGVVVGTYRDRLTGESFRFFLTQFPRLEQGQFLVMHLFARSVAPNSVIMYDFEGTLTGTSRIVGQLTSQFRSSARTDSPVSVALALERQ